MTEKGFGREQLTEISRITNADNSDVYDVLAYIAFALTPIARSERVEARRREIFSHYETPMMSVLFTRKASDADAYIPIHGVRRSNDHPFPRRVFPGQTSWRRYAQTSHVLYCSWGR
jgi:hypothetical protein